MEKLRNETNNESPQNHVSNNSPDVTDIIGKYGPWQRLIFILACLRGIPTAFFNISTPFFAPETNFNVLCAPPENLLNITSEAWKDILSNTSAVLAKRGYDCRCRMFAAELNSPSNDITINWNKTVACTRWIYDDSFYSSTIIGDFHLMCDRQWMISFTQSLYMAGMMVGVFIFGHLADRFGRRPIINICVILMMCSGIAVAFSPSFVLFSVFRFTLALGVAGAQAATFSLLMEVLGPEYRDRVTFAFSMGWVLGCFLLTGLGYLIRNWRTLQLVFMAITSIVLSYLCYLPESPRWLITQRKYDKAELVMLKAMKKNNLKVPNMEGMLSELQEHIEMEKQKKLPTIIDLFRTSTVRRYTIYIYFIYFSTGFVFYGFVLAQPSLGLNPFLSFFIGSLVELIAYILCLFFTKYLYRRTSMLIFLLISSGACFLMIPSSEGYFWLKIGAAMVGKLNISGATTLVAIHAAEVFPTVVRTVGLGSSLIFSRIGALSVPFIKELRESMGNTVPLIVFGMLSFLAAFMVYLLPETFNRSLPDTMLDAENMRGSARLQETQKKLLTENSKNEPSLSKEVET